IEFPVDTPVRVECAPSTATVFVRDPGGSRLVAVTSNPLDLLSFQNQQITHGITNDLIYINRDTVEFLDKEPSVMDTLADLSEEDLEELGQLAQTSEAIEDVAWKAPVVRLVDAIICEAYRKRASDIHLEPTQDGVSLRYRIDGILYEQLAPPKQLFSAIASRIKILSQMNIAEKRLPQDGKIRMKVGLADLDIRVATVPSVYGESLSLRLLDKSANLRSLQQLGLSEYDLSRMNQLLRQNTGIILVTGPTGGGKTTSLYAILTAIQSPERKILTLEDPIEYEISGITQIQVRPKIGLTFADGLRSLLRHDPDVLMVGEIRDRETAEMAVQASLTGHLVLSSLHTNDAPGALTRLLDMGIEPYLIASSLKAVLAQRLVRVLCTKCKSPVLEGGGSYEAVGCSFCDGKGFYGRTAIYELMICDRALRQEIMAGSDTEQTRRLAIEGGMRTMIEDGRIKASCGTTTMDEVQRVLGSGLVQERM
ncbi:MAG: GspE/PulE family protein, partial [Limnochordia bacterium]|nr:GspE/PulE family protein [Limnochordia bacterium]